eukprot:gene8582-6022_t
MKSKLSKETHRRSAKTCALDRFQWHRSTNNHLRLLLLLLLLFVFCFMSNTVIRLHHCDFCCTRCGADAMQADTPRVPVHPWIMYFSATSFPVSTLGGFTSCFIYFIVVVLAPPTLNYFSFFLYIYIYILLLLFVACFFCISFFGLYALILNLDVVIGSPPGYLPYIYIYILICFIFCHVSERGDAPHLQNGPTRRSWVKLLGGPSPAEKKAQRRRGGYNSSAILATNNGLTRMRSDSLVCCVLSSFLRSCMRYGVFNRSIDLCEPHNPATVMGPCRDVYACWLSGPSPLRCVPAAAAVSLARQ